MPHATHSNAALTPSARLKLAQAVIVHGWSIAQAATFHHVSWKTAAKWVERYREHGRAGMLDRSSARHQQSQRTSRALVRQIVTARLRFRMGPMQIADRTGVPASTVHAVLVRCRLNRLTHIDRVTGEPIRRYEHEKPGDMLHQDVTKYGRIPDGGGRRFLGQQEGQRMRAATAARTGNKSATYHPRMGTCYLHTVVDDHSRVAYVEAHLDEKKETAAMVLRNAIAWFAERGVSVTRVLTDNGGAYRSHHWKEACAELGVTHKRTRPYRPQTNGKVERFHRTLNDGWAYKKFYTSEAERLEALAPWIHYYNHHRSHSAIGKVAPITRLDNLAGHHT